ncbi:E3 ubiquitin-protein ligase PUB23-like [Neltuma alba]|uniref:E3 ubiquitin-protein ligase PUB23-like n=1 Tax=Neltuma alba TaxID=207710 RepID=UPI0010A3C055|nr:E3 ubiquitin-protein ligase PUB23-like [Prosopis alba]
MDENIEVPPFFLCPISLEIMKDPITVSSGITYDRESIEKWLFSGKNKTCPVTKQPLSVSDSSDLVPNHTLRRLIQSWCTMNASHGIERIPTPKPPINKTQVAKIIRDASRSSQSPVKCLQTLKSIASDSDANKRSIEAAGAVEYLASIVLRHTSFSYTPEEASPDDDGFELKTSGGDEALSILHSLRLSEAGLKSLVSFENGSFIDCLTRIMQRGFYESRAYAVLLLKSMFEVADPSVLSHLKPEMFVELVQLLKDQISQQASKATLRTLIQTCPWGRNRIRAVEAGGVSVLIELLLDCKDRKPCEMMLVLLEMLCGCAEGRAELLSHGAGIAIVSKKILRVSTMANDRAARILLSIAKFSATPSVLQEMLQVGVVAKLCLVLQVESGRKAQDKAREILRMHSRAWRNSPCIPSSLLSSYPN